MAFFCGKCVENLFPFNEIKENYNLTELFLRKIGQVALAQSVTGSSVASQRVEFKKTAVCAGTKSRCFGWGNSKSPV